MKPTMKPTIAQKITEEMQGQGYRYLATVSGQYSFRKGSNLARYLESQGLTENDVVVKVGRKNRHATEGNQLLVFVKA